MSNLQRPVLHIVKSLRESFQCTVWTLKLVGCELRPDDRTSQHLCESSQQLKLKISSNKKSVASVSFFLITEKTMYNVTTCLHTQLNWSFWPLAAASEKPPLKQSISLGQTHPEHFLMTVRLETRADLWSEFHCEETSWTQVTEFFHLRTIAEFAHTVKQNDVFLWTVIFTYHLLDVHGFMTCLWTVWCLSQ